MNRQFAYFGLGDFQSARADAEAELAKLKADKGDAAAYQYATIYAQWGNRAKGLEWLDTAMLFRMASI